MKFIVFAYTIIVLQINFKGRRGRDRIWITLTLSRDVLDTTLCDKVCQLFGEGR